MKIDVTDFNGADSVIASSHSVSYDALEGALKKLPLQLKASDQAGKLGTLIFDPVGTNEAIKTEIPAAGFVPNFRVPESLSILGKDVDFAKSGLLVEVQFSNYPFLMNNLLRSELFYKAQAAMPDVPMDALVIVTKSSIFSSSNSTLYYEQARDQLAALSHQNVFDVPVRLIGLSAPLGSSFEVRVNRYHAPRYSRTLVESSARRAIATPSPHPRGRPIITIQDL